METITITLNGLEVSGHTGMSILDLAKESGVDIPTLCHSPYLDSVGACRICIVEDERSGKLMASCVTPIASGMVINTQSPSVLERRKTILKMLLASHPDTCIVCDKGNMCKLRKIASEMGVGLIDIPRIPQQAKVEELNPFIIRDLSKCILCAKCIRSDQELVVIGAIDYINRGFIAKPATVNDLPLENSECTFCGTCVAMCPTGALSEKEKTYRGASSTLVKTICPYCGCGCGISLDIKDNYLVRSKPDEDNRLNHRTLCVRGSYGYDFVHSPDRLTSPLAKVDGEFKEISWDEALETVANNFNQIKENHGNGSISVFGSSKCTNEENYLLQKFTRCALSNNNIDNGSRLYNSANHTGLIRTIGFTGSTTILENLEKSNLIFVIGANPTSSAPLVGYAIKRAVKYNGTKLVLINIRQNELTSWAHLSLKLKPGTDITLINGIAKAIVDRKTYNSSLCNNIENFEPWAKSLEAYTPEYVEKATSIPGKSIPEVAQFFADASEISIIYGSGITQYSHGADAVSSLANLARLTGNIRDNECNIYALQRENNGQGSCDMGALPDYLPAYINTNNNEARKTIEELWKCQLLSDPGLTATEIFSQARSNPVRGMYIVGENPALSLPDGSNVEKRLTSLEFLVVQDIFLTETAKLADIVLPAASFAEKEGTFTNFEGRVQRLRKAIEPIGNSRPDWQIIVQLANKMGYPMSYSSPDQIMTEIDEITNRCRGWKYSKRGMNYINPDSLNKESNKSGRFYTVESFPESIKTDSSYPFMLCTDSILYSFGTGSRSSKASRLNEFASGAYAEINRLDAKGLNINDGDNVRIKSLSGEITVTARINENIDKGMIFIPMSFPDSPVNKVFGIIGDPPSKIPSFKTCPVKMERI